MPLGLGAIIKANNVAVIDPTVPDIPTGIQVVVSNKLPNIPTNITVVTV